MLTKLQQGESQAAAKSKLSKTNPPHPDGALDKTPPLGKAAAEQEGDGRAEGQPTRKLEAEGVRRDVADEVHVEHNEVSPQDPTDTPQAHV
jgi:hypothetical protein